MSEPRPENSWDVQKTMVVFFVEGRVRFLKKTIFSNLLKTEPKKSLGKDAKILQESWSILPRHTRFWRLFQRLAAVLKWNEDMSSCFTRQRTPGYLKCLGSPAGHFKSGEDPGDEIASCTYLLGMQCSRLDFHYMFQEDKEGTLYGNLHGKHNYIRRAQEFEDWLEV